jgi:hypothetical protein
VHIRSRIARSCGPGRLLNKYITLTDAASAGARELALGVIFSDPCDPAIAQATRSGSAFSPPPLSTARDLTQSRLIPDWTGMLCLIDRRPQPEHRPVGLRRAIAGRLRRVAPGGHD